MAQRIVLMLLVLAGCASTPANELGGTSWRLVKFEGGDGTILTPDDPSKYTLSFNRDGSVAARIDCNRGRAAWKSTAPSQLELGPLALTRAACPPGSLHDHIVKQWPYVRSYVVKDGRLYLSLMADGGIYELEPAARYPLRVGRSPYSVDRAAISQSSVLLARKLVLLLAHLAPVTATAGPPAD